MDRRRFLLAGVATLSAFVTACRGKDSPKGRPATTLAPPTTTSTEAMPRPGEPARYVARGDKVDQVVLTFHASGDLTLADAMLAKLEATKTRATVFVVGEWLEAHPQMATKITTGGHELGNHTYSHLDFGKLSQSAMASEITRCRDVLQRLTGSPGKWFRPSSTDAPTPQMLAEAGKAGYSTSVGYDVDPLDYEEPGSKAVVERVASAVKGGSIISLHFGHQGTVPAMDGILSDLRSKGLTPVTMSELLG